MRRCSLRSPVLSSYLCRTVLLSIGSFYRFFSENASLRDFCPEMGYNEHGYNAGGQDADSRETAAERQADGRTDH